MPLPVWVRRSAVLPHRAVDLLRRHARRVREGIACAGDLTDDFVVQLLHLLCCLVFGFLLDGFPRTIAQAEALDAILERNDEKVTSVVSIMIPDWMIVERISHRAAIEGRTDDSDVTIIKSRIDTYHNQTEPLIDYYKAAGTYNEIDGVGTIEEVRDRIFKLVDKF